MANTYNNDALMRLPDVLEIVPVCRASWYAGIKAGRFPQPVRLGPRCVAWRQSDVHRLVQVGIGSAQTEGVEK